MATQRQIEANRRNALKSTGPKTAEGKAAVRLNSLRHGLRARTVVLPGENPQEFLQLCDALEAEWQPLTHTEQFYVDQMTVAQWKLNRMEVAEASIYSQPKTPQIQIPLLDRLWQAQGRLERSFARAQHELERIQVFRQSQQPEEPAPAIKIVPAAQPPTAAELSPPAVLRPQSSVFYFPAALTAADPDHPATP